ncbi:kinase-like domain-containing protein [Haematococcus lacustris]
MLDGASYSARSLDSLKQEIQVLSRLQHPHIVRFIGACLAPPNVCIVEQLATGGSLYGLLHNRRQRGGAAPGPPPGQGLGGLDGEAAPPPGEIYRQLECDTHSGQLPYEQVLRLGAEVASAMAYLHSLHIVHRDLKPANVLLDAQGSALVADFGIAKFRGTATFLSTRNVHAGTPAYMAPEQFEGRPVSERVDQFAFAVMLWEMVTGQPPWGDLEHPMQIIFMVGVQGGRLPLPASCPPVLAALISACWSEDPADRPRFAEVEQSMRAELARHCQQQQQQQQQQGEQEREQQQ